MRVTNTSGTARALSHRGRDYRLLPGASADVPMTKDEAKALSAVFDITGEPEAEARPVKIKRSYSGARKAHEDTAND